MTSKPTPDRADRSGHTNRRGFLGAGAMAAAAVAVAGPSPSSAAPVSMRDRKVRVGVIGCGSVSRVYLPELKRQEHIELVSLCDRRVERANERGAAFGVAHRYPSLETMLAGEPFELLVNLTDMQEHGAINERAIDAGKHVWSEKPLHNTSERGHALLERARARGVRIWGAPTVVNSPQFATMSQAIASGSIGRVSAAHACYGHLGPNWSAFFYEKGGGSLPDLGVYNLTFLTGLLGPARAVSAMTSIVTPERTVGDKGKVRVEAEDNAMVLMDHGAGKISHVMCGFNDFDPHGHDGDRRDRPTLFVTGTGGRLGLLGYDWAPKGVEVSTAAAPEVRVETTDARGYVWEQGAAIVAKCLLGGPEPLFRVEHALHVLEIIEAARASGSEGRRVPIRSTFPWPIVTA
jgi:predicted dehydrogenase